MSTIEERLAALEVSVDITDTASVSEVLEGFAGSILQSTSSARKSKERLIGLEKANRWLVGEVNKLIKEVAEIRAVLEKRYQEVEEARSRGGSTE